MTLDPGSTRGLLLIGGGTGLAPVKALAEQAAASGRDVHLLVGARTEDGLYDLPALRELEAGCARLRVIPVLSDAPPPPGGLHGRIPDVLPRFLDGARGRRDHDAYLAGPAPLVRRTVTALQWHGMPLTRIHHDLLAAEN